MKLPFPRVWGFVVGAVVVVGIAVALLFLLQPRPTPPSVGSIVARVEARPDTTRIGRPLAIRFEVRTPAEHQVAFAPQPADDSTWTWQRWEVTRPILDESGVYHGLEAIALPFRTGTITVPTPPFRVTRPDGESAGGAFPELAVRVESVLPPGEVQPDIHGLKPPFELPWWVRFPWWIVFVVVALAALGWWAYRRWHKRPVQARPQVAPVTTEVIPAHVEALEALDALIAEELPRQRRWYEHQTRLSAILRRYLERRLGTPRESLTTRELLLHLAWTGIERDDVDRIHSLLRVADLAKFAHEEPTVEDGLGLEREARNLIVAWRDRDEARGKTPSEARPDGRESEAS